MIKDEHGVTMMELMIVTVVIGLLAALAVPNMSGAIKKMKFNNFGSSLVSALRQARSTAVSTQRPYGVFFNIDASKVITFCDMTDIGANTYSVGDSIARVDTIDVKLDYLGTSFPNQTVVFNPDGTASMTGDIFCYGSAAANYQTFSVSVTAGSGRARLEQYGG
jgi:prepilin-type N-terminal cleavage/methylation domain-containing protein